MTTITIDGTDYELEGLSDEIRAELQMVQLTDQELIRLQALTAMAQTARAAYAKRLNELLSKSTEVAN